MPTTYVKARTAGIETVNKLVASIENEIKWVHPFNAPFTFWTMLGGKKEATQFKHEWFDDELQPRQSAINLAAGYASTDTSLVVDNGSYFSPGDMVWVPRTNEVFRVSAVSSNTLSTVVRGGSFGTTAAALLDNDILIILANANPEHGKDPESKSTLEANIYNYCQTIKSPCTISDRAMKAKHYGGADFKMQLAKKTDEHSMDIELAMLFNGTPVNYAETIAALYSTASDKTTTMGGFINWYMVTYGTAPTAGDTNAFTNFWTEEEMTENEFENINEKAFTHGGKGRQGKRRKLFLMGPKMVTGFEHWMKTKLDLKTSDKTGGLEFANWQSAHGKLKLIPHNALKAYDANTYTYGLIVDAKECTYVYHTGRDTRVMANRQNPNVDGRSDLYMTDCCGMYRLAKLHTVIKMKEWA